MASRSQAILINYKDGRRLHKQQEHTLGQVGVDRDGNYVVYGQFKETAGWGEGYRHGAHGDVSVDDPGEIDEAAAAGTDEITLTGENYLEAIEGAYFQVVAGGGAGQIGVVMKRLGATKLKIAVLFTNSGPTKANNRTLQTALTTASRIEFFLPGQFYKADGQARDYNAGISHITGGVGTDDVDKFGWVRQTGLIPLLGGTADADARGVSIKFNSFGRAIAVLGSDLPNVVIGTSLVNTTANGRVMYANLDIPEHPISTLLFDREHAYNKVVIQN